MNFFSTNNVIIDKGIRLTHYLVDMSIILIGWVIISIFILDLIVMEISFYLLIITYYFLMEVYFYQTVGKMITGMMVVSKDGGPVSISRVLLRSILRLFPLDLFSFVFGTERGLHDVLSFTRVVKKTRINEAEEILDSGI